MAAEDERDSVELLRIVLEDASATVSTARSGPEALDAIRQGFSMSSSPTAVCRGWTVFSSSSVDVATLAHGD